MSETLKIKINNELPTDITVKKMRAVSLGILIGDVPYEVALEVTYLNKLKLSEGDSINIISCGVKGRVIKHTGDVVYDIVYVSQV
jgi:hypothetical protein